jgi:ppGpp synthetase/RelA/SpoT-type nucleotidyltranferase
LAWSQLEHSKKAVRRAGDYLISGDLDIDMFLESYSILENWRTSHAYPIQSMLGYFRKKAFSIDENAVIVQRLKRTPSILAKLRRENGMKLDRIEDIGGCRIVVSTKLQVYEVSEAIRSGRTRNELRRHRDYIKEPKDSGYRGVHLVYRYNGQKNEYLNHAIELQIRSKVQHSWATAVEVVGTFTGQALKAGQGRDAWLNFFKLASIAFSDIENRSLARNSERKERLELIKYIERLAVLPKLQAFVVSTQSLGVRNSNDAYFLLVLDVEIHNIQVRRFPPEEFVTATEEYANFERKYRDNVNKDVVLVSAESISGLKKAYPNYFADTREFSRNLERILDIHK